MRNSTRAHPDQAIAELAARQHGVIALPQLVALGIGRGAVAWGVRAGRLHPLHRGVYAVGHALVSREGRWSAAVLACGNGAVLSHRSAAALWGLRPTAAAAIDVTVASRAGRARLAGLIVHRSGRLTAEECTPHREIPVTTVARTLLDLAEVVPARVLERAADDAEALRLFDLAALERVVTANPRRYGARRVAALLRDHAVGTTLTRSALEERFLALCAAHGAPRPAVNARVEGVEVDFAWPKARLVVETDGHRHHGTRQAFERDRARDARLTAAGLRVVRLTYRRLEREPAAVARELAALLGGDASYTSDASAAPASPATESSGSG